MTKKGKITIGVIVAFFGIGIIGSIVKRNKNKNALTTKDAQDDSESDSEEEATYVFKFNSEGNLDVNKSDGSKVTFDKDEDNEDLARYAWMAFELKQELPNSSISNLNQFVNLVFKDPLSGSDVDANTKIIINGIHKKFQTISMMHNILLDKDKTDSNWYAATDGDYNITYVVLQKTGNGMEFYETSGD